MTAPDRSVTVPVSVAPAPCADARFAQGRRMAQMTKSERKQLTFLVNTLGCMGNLLRPDLLDGRSAQEHFSTGAEANVRITIGGCDRYFLDSLLARVGYATDYRRS